MTEGDELLDAAVSGDTKTVARFLASDISPERAANALARAVSNGRLEVVDQLHHWSIERTGKPLMQVATVLDMLSFAEYLDKGEDPELTARLASLRSTLQGRSPEEASSGDRALSVSYAVAGESAIEEPTSELAPLSVPERGLTLVSDQPQHSMGAVEAGVETFTDRMFSTHPQWSILAVEADASQLAPRLSEFLKADIWVADAADRVLEEAEREYFLLQLRDHRWSLLLTVSLPTWPPSLAEEAKRLSAELDLPTVAFGYEETGGASVAQLFESGRPGKRARGRKSWQAFFCRLNLYIPVFGLYSEEGRTTLVLEDLERSQVEALHFFA